MLMVNKNFHRHYVALDEAPDLDSKPRHLEEVRNIGEGPPSSTEHIPKEDV